MNDFVNDNGAFDSASYEPDAHGQAALLLAESLLHHLVERSIMNLEEAVNVVNVAADAAQEIASNSSSSGLPATQSSSILKRISKSLSHDL